MGMYTHLNTHIMATWGSIWEFPHGGPYGGSHMDPHRENLIPIPTATLIARASHLNTVEPHYYEHQGIIKMCLPFPEFAFTTITCFEKALKGTEKCSY